MLSPVHLFLLWICQPHSHRNTSTQLLEILCSSAVAPKIHQIKLNTRVQYLKLSSPAEPKVLLSWLEINFETYLRCSVDEQYPIGGVYKADSTSNLKAACGRRPWVLSKSSDLLGGRFWMLSHGTWACEGICSTAPWHVSPGEPRCNTWAT